jgi:hypothetical protein
MTDATLALTAQRLIQKRGRGVSLVKRSEVDANPAEPWRATDGVTTTVTLTAVLVPFASEDMEETLARRGEIVAYVAALDGGTAELEKFDELLDGTDVWKITGGKVINPGATRILYILNLMR